MLPHWSKVRVLFSFIPGSTVSGIPFHLQWFIRSSFEGRQLPAPVDFFRFSFTKGKWLCFHINQFIKVHITLIRNALMRKCKLSAHWCELKQYDVKQTALLMCWDWVGQSNLTWPNGADVNGILGCIYITFLTVFLDACMRVLERFLALDFLY